MYNINYFFIIGFTINRQLTRLNAHENMSNTFIIFYNLSSYIFVVMCRIEVVLIKKQCV